MPDRREDGTFVYTSLRHATNYAEMGGFDVVKDNVGTMYASRSDMDSYFELVEIPGPYLNYIWQRVHARRR